MICQKRVNVTQGGDIGRVKGITRLSIVNFQCLIEIFDLKWTDPETYRTFIIKFINYQFKSTIDNTELTIG
jgi:hypothetical protein